MREQHNGHIINVSSISSVIDYPTIGYYGAVKAFIEKVTTTMSVELKPWSIRCSLFIPGAVSTNFGKQMLNISDFHNQAYETLYSQWAKRFNNYFRTASTAEQAARALARLVKEPRDIMFINQNDRRWYFLRKWLGPRFFNRFLLARHIH
jgi:short-subunit dehydrogenase